MSANYQRHCPVSDLGLTYLDDTLPFCLLGQGRYCDIVQHLGERIANGVRRSSRLCPKDHYVLIAQHPSVTQDEPFLPFDSTQLPRHLRKRMHAVIIPRAAETRQASQQRKRLWATDYRERKRGRGKLGHDGEARIYVYEI